MAPVPGRPTNLPLLAASIAGGLLLVAMFVAWVPPPASSSGPTFVHLPVAPPPPAPPTALTNVSIVPAQTSYLVPARAFVDVLFHLSMPAQLAGDFDANANISVSIVDPAGFGAFENGAPVSASLWFEGPVTDGSVAPTLPAGTYYLVFSALPSAAPITVHIATGIEAVFPLPPVYG